MKKLIEVVEVEGEGLTKLLGEHVMLFCVNYIYVGTLIGVNTTDVLLRDAEIVYETGELTAKQFKDAQKLPSEWGIKTSLIESYGKSGRT